jgi:hypothetical protein
MCVCVTSNTHGTRGRTRAHGSHRRTSQPSKPTNTQPACQRDDRSRGRLNSRRPGADRSPCVNTGRNPKNNQVASCPWLRGHTRAHHTSSPRNTSRSVNRCPYIYHTFLVIYLLFALKISPFKLSTLRTSRSLLLDTLGTAAQPAPLTPQGHMKTQCLEVGLAPRARLFYTFAAQRDGARQRQERERETMQWSSRLRERARGALV